MGFLSSLAVGFFSGVCLIAGLQFFQQRRSRARLRKAADLAALGNITAEELRHLIPNDLFPSWIQFPEFERVKWLNRQMLRLWPYVNKAASAIIRTSVEPILEQYRPPVFVSLHFQKLTLGTIAPQFGGVKLVDTGQKEIVMEIDFKWGGNPSIILLVQTYLGVALPVQVKDVALFGIVRVSLSPLVDELPCIGAVTVAFTQRPDFDFKLKVVGKDVKTIPGMSSILEGLLRAAVIDTLTWPSRIVVPIIPGDYRHLEMRQVGLLVVKLVEARGLLNIEMFSKSDPFAIVFVRPIPRLMKRSKIKSNNLNPIWNEEYELPVEDASSQRLVVRVMDHEDLDSDRLLGEVAIRMSDLEPGQLKDTWLKLVFDVDNPLSEHPPKERGEVHLELLYLEVGPDGWPVGSRPAGFGQTALEQELGFTSGSGIAPNHQERYQRGVLVVSIHKGLNLVSKNLNGSSDPFVTIKMQLDDTAKKTKVKKGELNPEWEETFEFLIEDARHDMLMVDIWDHDMFGKNFMGQLRLTLTKVLQAGELTNDFQLSEVKQGTLRMTLKWKPLH